MPSKTKFFPSAEEYNRLCNGSYLRRNCLKFSMGDTTPARNFLEGTVFSIYALSKSEKTGNVLEDLAKAFLKTVDGYQPRRKFDSTNFRRINSEDELKDGEYIFKVFGVLVDGYIYDFHIIRGYRSSSDGKIYWEHKNGWDHLAEEVHIIHFNALDQMYGNNFVLFSFCPPKH